MSEVAFGAAAGIALYDWLTSKGQDLTITDDITTQFSINAVTNVQTNCFQSANGRQAINVTSGPGDAFVNASPAPCTICLEALNQITTARTNLETEAATRNPGYTPQQANPVLQTIMTTGQVGVDTPQNPAPSTTPAALGPCTAMCNDLVVLDITQSQTFNAKETCNVITNVTTNISQTIKGQLDAYLKNQQDIIGQLESAFTSNQDNITTNLSSDLAQNLTENFTQSIHQQLSNTQFAGITGNSTIVDRSTQSFTGTMVGKLTVNNTIVDNLRQSAQYSISQTLLNKNDTIGDLTRDFLQVIQDMSSLLEELTSQILIIVGAVIASVLLLVGALYIFNKDFRGWFKRKVNNRHNTEIDKLRLRDFGKKEGVYDP